MICFIDEGITECRVGRHSNTACLTKTKRVGGVCLEFTQEYVNGLVEKYSDMILRIAYTYLKSKTDAEEVMQDVFLQIIDKRPDFQDATHEKSWIIRTTINLCKNTLNRFWNKHKLPIDEAVTAAGYDTYQLDNSVFQAVMSLSEQYRIAIYMFYYEGYSTLEIAHILKKSDAAVRTLLHRARNKLKSMLKEEYDFEQKV